MKATLFAIFACVSLFAEPQTLWLDRYLDLMHSYSSAFGYSGEAKKKN